MEVVKKIENIIAKYQKYDDFTGGESKEKIANIEKILAVNLPVSYKWFLEKYGYGGLFGVNILGGGKDNYMTCVEETQDYQKYGLPMGFVAIENCDEWLYVLDTNHMKDGECPVVYWDQTRGLGKHSWNNFYDFFLERLSDVIENND